ncbi:Rib/alpha-like domain-containing protein [Streptococcus acidominimus]
MKSRQKMDWYRLGQRFSIRKYHFGAASVLLGAALLLGMPTVQADEEVKADTELMSRPEDEEVKADTELTSQPTAEEKEVSPVVESPTVEPVATTTDEKANELPTSSAVEEKAEGAGLPESAVDSKEELAETVAPKAEAREAVEEEKTTPNTLVEEISEAVASSPKASTDAISSTTPVEKTSEVPVSRSAFRTAGDGVVTTQAYRIEFLDANHNVLDPTAIFNGQAGKNMRINVRVTFPESTTSKEIDITLGNFLAYNDSGASNDSVKSFIDGTSKLSNQVANIYAKDNTPYRNTYNTSDTTYATGQKLTYRVKENVKSLTIPLTFSAQNITGLTGFSSDGTLNGSSEGVERTSPITVIARGVRGGQTLQNQSELSKLSVPDFVQGNIGTYFVSSHISPELQQATTNNGYQAMLGMGLSVNLTSDNKTFGPLLVENHTFDLVLPNGVSFIGFSDKEAAIFEKLSETTETNGTTRVSFKVKEAYSGAFLGFFQKVQVDRSVVTGSSAIARLENQRMTLRNYEQPYALRPQVVRQNYPFNIVDLTEQDDIDFMNTGRVGVANSYYPNYNVLPISSDTYTSLGSLPFTLTVKTLDDHDSREKELRYEFPSNPAFEVKGIQLPLLNNGNTVTTVKVASKNNPVLREVTLPKTYTASSVAEFIDVLDLGLSEDDVLTELIIPMGVFRAGQEYDMPGRLNGRQSSVFGKVLDEVPEYVASAKLTLRDKDFDENNPDKNWSNPSGTLNVRLRKAEGRNDVRVTTPGNRTINYGAKNKLVYNIYSDRDRQSHWMRTNDKVEKIHLVLPSDVLVKNVVFKDQTGTVFTPEVIASNRVEGDNTIYTYDFTNAEDYRYIGWIGSAGKHFRDQSIVMEVEVENDVVAAKSVGINQTLFVQIAEDTIRPQTGSESQRGQDPYNLVENDNVLFTNKPVTTLLTLPKPEQLDIRTSVKLSTDTDYVSAGETFTITERKQDLQLQLGIGNKLQTEVGEVDLFVPIPKKGQNFGSNFQREAFKFNLLLKGVSTAGNSHFDNIFTISYAKVDASKLNGTQLTTQDLGGESFSSAWTPDTNLIRIQTKSGVNIPATVEFPVELTFGLDNLLSEDDGQSITWNPYYSATYSDGSKVEKARDISLDVALGKVGVQFFEDLNGNGIQDEGEEFLTDFPSYRVLDETGAVLDTSKSIIQDKATKQVVKGLSSGDTYTIQATAPEGKRFTTGKKSETATRTSQTMEASLTDVATAPALSIGIMKLYTVTSPEKTLVDNPTSLTPEEKAAVEAAVKKANGDLPSNLFIASDAQGNVTLTYPDGFVQTIPSSETVGQKEGSAQPLVNPIDTDDTSISGTGIAGSKIEVTLPDGTIVQTTVNPEGNWSISTTPLKADQQVSVVQTEVDKRPSTPPVVTVVTTAADRGLTDPVLTKVDTTYKLSSAEKRAVEEAIRTANSSLPSDATITVADNGEASVTFGDQSRYVFAPEKTVVEKEVSALPTIDPVDNDDTTITGTGSAGSSITVSLPTGQDLTTTVGADGTWSVQLPKPLPQDVAVKASQTEVDKKPSPQTTQAVAPNQASQITPVIPKPIIVDNTSALTPAEIAAVEEAIRTATPDLPENTGMSVDPQGNVTLTYPDGSSDYLHSTETVRQRPTSETPTIKPVDNDDTSLTGTGIPGATITVTLPGQEAPIETTVHPDGTWSIALPTPLASDETVSAIQTVPEKRPSQPSQATVTPTVTTSYELVAPEGTTVDDVRALTPAEQALVEQAIKKANPDLPKGTSIAVGPDGRVVATYSDGSSDTLTPDQTITQRATTPSPVIRPVDTDDTVLKGTGVPGASVTVSLPDGDTVTTTVRPDGSWKVVLESPLSRDEVVSATQTEAGKKPSGQIQETVQPTQAESIEPNASKPVAVDNPSELTAAEKEAVKEAIKDSNPDLPENTSITVDPQGNVTLTYPDGSKDHLPAQVEQTDKGKYEPTVKADEPNTPAISAGKALIDGSDVPESPLSPADQEAVKDKVDTSNLPEGTTVTPADKVTGTPDNPVVEVTVTYPDGTTDTIEVPVKQKDSASNEPTVKPDEANTPTVSAGKALIDGSDTPESPLTDADKAVVADKVDTSNLPQGTVVTPADKVSGTPENPVVEVTVTYPDGTTDTIEVPVKQKESASNEPTVKPDADGTPEISAGKVLIDGSNKPESPLTDADKEAVKDKVDTSNLPAGTTVTPADKVTGTEDAPVVEVTVTYPDGTTDTIEVPVKQKDSATNEPAVKPDEANTPAISAGKALIDGSDTPESPLSDADKAVVADKVDTSNLPQGTVVTPADKVTGTPDNPVVEVTVTYPDGTTDTIEVPVKQKDSATNEPSVKADEPNTPAISAGKALIDGSDTPESPLSPADQEAVKDKVDTSKLPDGTTVTPADKVSGTPDNPVVEVTVTYPDGTTDTIAVPVKQKDSATNEPAVKPDEANTPAISTGKALIDGSDTPESPLSPADQEAVKDKVDTSNLPAGTIVTPADKVSGTPENPVVEVTVTYPDGTTDTVNIPVKQKDSASNEPTVKPDKDGTPEISAGKALIDGSDKPESPLSPADQEAVKDKVDTSNLPAGTTVTPADKVTGTPDNPVVEVTVTYPDGTTDTINVPVKQKDSASNEPSVKADEPNTPAVSAGKALIDGSDAPESPLSPADQEVVKDKVDTSNLPEGTTVTPADKVTGTPENPVVEVTVTYPDGTTDTIEVPVKQKESASNEPTVKPDEANTPTVSAGKVLIDGSDKPESPLSPADQEAVKDKVDTSNLPAGTTVTPADKVTGTPADKVTGTPENPVVEVTVTYPDGTTDTIEVPVKQKESASNEPTVKPDADGTPEISAGKVLLDGSDTPNSPLTDADKAVVADKVDTSKLPEGTTVTPADKVTGTEDNPVVEVTVTYPDGTTDTIEVPVKQKDSASNEPTVKPDEANTPTVSAGKALIDGSDTPESPLTDADKEAVKDKVDTSKLPDGTTVTPADKVTGTPENPVVEVTVTYPDGTTDTIAVPVKQKDSASNEPAVKPEEPNTPAISTGKALIDGSDTPESPLSDTDKAVITDKVDTSNLPEGTVVTPADKVTGTPDNPVVEVTVTYPDGTTDTINVPVKQKDSAINEPSVKADEPNTPAISTGKALIDGSDTPNSPLTDADKEAVKDKVDTSKLPEGTTVTPADKVTGTPDNPVVEVTITYPDGTTDTIEVPVKQKDSASNEPTVKPDEANTPTVSAGKALIDGSDTPESPLTDADKEAVKDKVDTSNLPEGTTVTPADKVSGTPANPVVLVTITYPDGTTDTIEVPVKQKDSMVYQPQLPSVTEVGNVNQLTDQEKEQVKAAFEKANPQLPAGTKIFVSDKGSLAVIFPDGTGFEIDGAYIVRGKNTPAPQAGEVKPVSLAGQDQIRKQAQLPNTGESSAAGTQVAGLLTVLGTSLFWLMSKGRKEEE